MSRHGLTKENFVATLPVALQKDPSAVALAQAMADLLAGRTEEIDRLRIYPAIDRLGEPLLGDLAYDFKVDWWDPDYSLEEKRRTLKDSWRVHKKMGTKAAVEWAIRAIYPKTTVEPWFEYEGGEPYHFRLHIDLSDEQLGGGKPRNVLDRVRFYQSLRDHLDSVQYTMEFPPVLLHAGGVPGALLRLELPQEADQYVFCSTIHSGGAGGIHAESGLVEETSAPKRTGTLGVGGTTAIRPVLPVQVDAAPPPSTTILRTGGVCTIISNLQKGE